MTIPDRSLVRFPASSSQQQSHKRTTMGSEETTKQITLILLCTVAAYLTVALSSRPVALANPNNTKNDPAANKDGSVHLLRGKQEEKEPDELQFQGPRQLPLDWDRITGLNILFTRPGRGKKGSIHREYRMKFTPEGALKGQATSEQHKKPFPVNIPPDHVREFKTHLNNITMFQALYSNEFDPLHQAPSNVYHPHYVQRASDSEYRFRFEAKTLDEQVEVYTKSHMACHKKTRICGRLPWVVRFQNFQNPLSDVAMKHWLVNTGQFDDAFDAIEQDIRG